MGVVIAHEGLTQLSISPPSTMDPSELLRSAGHPGGEGYDTTKCDALGQSTALCFYIPIKFATRLLYDEPGAKAVRFLRHSSGMTRLAGILP